MTLSEERAHKVAEYLTLEFEIAASRLRAFGRGTDEPLNENDLADAVNRRVEIRARDQESLASHAVVPVARSHRVTVIPSLAWFAHARKGQCWANGSGALAIAPSASQSVQIENLKTEALPGTAQEVGKLIEYFPDATVLVDSAARLEALRELRHRHYRVLLFSGHSVPAQGPGTPFAEPVLVLGPSMNSKENEILSASDILQLGISADVVILSSSMSLVDRLESGTSWHISRIAKAFLANGSKEVVATYFSPDDAGAAELVSVLLRDLEARPDVAAMESVSRAMDEFSSRTSPMTWAAYGVLGNAGRPCLEN
jgi:CHAT domain-containing protein